MSPAGQKFVIVGGTSGMGKAVAEIALHQGATVVVAGRDAERARTVAAQLGAEAVGVACDLNDSLAIEALAAQVGSLDHLVLTAGAPVVGPFLELPVEDARRFFEQKFWGFYRALRALAPLLSERGSITVITGITAVRPSPGTSAIASVNAALEGLTRALAIELAPVRVNAVRPGIVNTPGWARIPEADRSELFKEMSEWLPVGRVGEPADIAKAVMELADNGYSTGEVRTVDGGARLA